MALTSGADTPSFGHGGCNGGCYGYGCGGCYGASSWNYSGCYGCYGYNGGCNGCNGGHHGRRFFGGHGHHRNGCNGYSYGCNGCYGWSSCYGCNGCYGFGGCYGCAGYGVGCAGCAGGGVVVPPVGGGATGNGGTGATGGTGGEQPGFTWKADKLKEVQDALKSAKVAEADAAKLIADAQKKKIDADDILDEIDDLNKKKADVKKGLDDFIKKHKEEETNNASQEAPATLVVKLPADATLTIDDQATKSTSAKRVFVTPALKPGAAYYYTLKATVVREGQAVVTTKVVQVRPGAKTQVKLDIPAASSMVSK
jgi:uncharacterized protein (TIGR03000 family)